MSGETTITVVGNLTADPELRFTPGGDAVANFTVASTPRQFDRQTNEWRDGDTLFMPCSVWKSYAENVAETLRKGMQVMVQGHLVQRSWEKDGEKRSRMELRVTEVGPTLRFTTGRLEKSTRSERTAQADRNPAGSGGDPWSTGAGSFGDEPPF